MSWGESEMRHGDRSGGATDEDGAMVVPQASGLKGAIESGKGLEMWPCPDSALPE